MSNEELVSQTDYSAWAEGASVNGCPIVVCPRCGRKGAQVDIWKNHVEIRHGTKEFATPVSVSVRVEHDSCIIKKERSHE